MPKETDFSLSVLVENSYKNQVPKTSAGLSKKPLKNKKMNRTLSGSLKDWVVFDGLSVSKPIHRGFLKKNDTKIQIKEKKTLQAWIPQPMIF